MFFLTKAFWIAAGERAGKTFAQALGAYLLGAGLGIVGSDWLTALNVSGMAALLSVLSSVASAGIGEKGSPSLVTTPPAAEPDLDGIHRTVARH
ncbi:MAG TPA: holin [Nocardioidaceae bacterium]